MGQQTNSLKLVFYDTGNAVPTAPSADVQGTLTAATATSTTVSKVYAVPYKNTPSVHITPTQNAGNFFLSASSNTGFTVTFTTAGTKTFSYLVISND